MRKAAMIGWINHGAGRRRLQASRERKTSMTEKNKKVDHGFRELFVSPDGPEGTAHEGLYKCV
jgi:hypothetical protein